ncbi:MAG: ATP-binding protein [Bacteroidales bacterium]|jgi:predicted AAA+ superfamily ATPase|nr:ATP-binding protein [Bacteroidales bacterium]
MYRYKIKELIDWKISVYRKPLIILGARQVGKTWLIEEFGKQEYRQTVYINFEKMKAVRNLFVEDFDVKRILTALSVFAHKEINPADTLIVFDEIQAVEGGLTSLKYFCEEASEYHVVAAGSLLGMSLHQNTSYPVGKVDFMYMHPLSFTEFLMALDEERLANLLENPDWKVINLFKDKLLTYLRYYLFVGGMPEVVQHFVDKRDFRIARNTQRRILTTYRNDFSKHAPRDIVQRINMVWKSIPTQMAKENKKFIYGVVKEGGRAKEFELAIQWLLDCGLLHQVYRVSKPDMPLAAYQDLAAFKLYHNDVGLLGAMAKLLLTAVIDGNTIFEEFNGSLTENFVLQQLLLKEENDIFYWTNENSTAEVDFVVQNDTEIIPIEVKSGESLKSVSFKFFREKYKPKRAIRTSLADYKEESWMTNVPLYAVNMI